MDPSFISQLFNYGFPSVIAVLLFFAYRDQTAVLLDALRNNTQAMIELKSNVGKTDSALETHDEQAKVILDCVQQTAQTVNRIDVRTLQTHEIIKQQFQQQQAQRGKSGL